MSEWSPGGRAKYGHLRAAIWELYPNDGAVDRLRARIAAINSEVLAGESTLSEAGMARLHFLTERLRQLDAPN